MTDWHPNRLAVESFMRGELGGSEAKRIVKHLVAGCPECQRVARLYYPCARPAAEAVSAERCLSSWRGRGGRKVGEIFEDLLPELRSRQADLESEQAEAPGLVERLERCPQERRLMLVENSERYRTWGLCDSVLERGFAMGPQDPAQALEWTELGVAIARNLSESTYSPELVHDLKARALSYLGNARRITSDLAGASRAFEEAEVELNKGTGDELELARLLELKSALLFEYRNFKQGFEILNRAIGIHRSSGCEYFLGRALIAKGFQLGELGDLEAAIATLKDGLKRIGTQEERLHLAAKHNLVYFLYSAGRYHQALAMVPEVRALHKEHGDAVDLVRFKWLEAKIAEGHGELEAAEAAFCEVRDFFAESEIPHEVAQVSLDLAILYLRQGRVAELKKLSSEMLVMFSSLGIGREAIAALVLFQQAVEMEKASFGLIRDLAAYLKNARNHPHLPFRPSSSA